MRYISSFVLLIFLISISCEWQPNLNLYYLNELLKDGYAGCSFILNDKLFILTSLIYEYDVKSRDERVWLDVGANKGKFTKYVYDVVPNAKIYSFEPFEPVYESLQSSLKDCENVKVYNLAISNTSEINKPFYTESGKENDDSFTRSSLKKIYSDYYIYEYINTTTLNDFYIENNLKEIFFLKIDTEGYDGIILNNSMNLIKEQKIKYLYFEYNNDWYTINPNLSWQYIVRVISNSGYNVYLEIDNMIYMSDAVIDSITIEGNSNGFCYNFLAIKRGLEFERNIINRLCPKCNY